MNKPLPELIDYLDKSNRWKHDANDNAEAIDQAVEVLKTMNWQPIETAPKDGSQILAAVRYLEDENFPGVWNTLFVYWDAYFSGHPEGIWAYDYEKPITSGKPTHWMPVPQYVEPIEELKEPPQPGTITLSGPGAKRWEEIYSMTIR